MEFTKENIKSIVSSYQLFYEKVSEIIDLHSKLDDCYYEIDSIEVVGEFISVSVNYYKWQDTNYDAIHFDLNLLTSIDEFSNFKFEVESKLNQREIKKQLELDKAKENKIQEAIKLLKDNGIFSEWGLI